MAKATPLTDIQRLVADTYEAGEFAHITTVEEAREVGDTLFTFLVYEAKDADDLDNFSCMLDRAIDQVNSVKHVVDAKAAL